MPSELWSMQQKAINNGLLSNQYKSWGLASPTGTGKTSIAQLLLLDYFYKDRTKKAFYIVPSRALAAQVAKDLSTVLIPLGIKVGALGSHLTYHDLVLDDPSEMDILVFTPEKADLILRIEPELIMNTHLVIVDEAHHIETGTRGILLEFYLWRLRSLLPKECRIIQLSAVAPNINELVGWLGNNLNTNHVKVDWRTGRLRIGLYERLLDGAGEISFPNDNKSITIQDPGTVPFDDISSLASLAERLSGKGIVLVLASSKKQAEEIASQIVSNRLNNNTAIKKSDNSLSTERLDARLERELYTEVPLREYFPEGVVYHHGGLPNRVRSAIEQVISEKRVNVVCATTTLAEGVNFPFSTVIVESLIIGTTTTLSPRGLWNIAGRAGRFGVDSEGHCILFKPSNWKHKIKGYKLEDYLHTDLDSIPPVKSAYATSLKLTKELIEKGEITIEDMNDISLSNLKSKIKGNKGKTVRGMLNMIRVGLTHAHSNKIINVRSDQINVAIDKMFAKSQMNEQEIHIGKSIELKQRKVITQTLENDETLFNIAAKIGWTLETQETLWKWIKTLEDWQIKSFGNMVRSGSVVDSDKLKFLLYPLASNMAEFEGDKLGGYTAYIAVSWIEGLSLTGIKESSGKSRTYDKLVEVIYSKTQYMLPWALYGVNELLLYEARIRRIKIGSGVKDLSILASEGVPNFDALSLVLKLDVERVDATRLSRSYLKRKIKSTDIIGWFKGLEWQTVAGIVSGIDRRRLDPDLKIIHDKIRSL